MIPDDHEELSSLAGEYVLGLLESHERHEIESAISTNNDLRAAIAFWEERLHPLSALARSAEPPEGTWAKIEAALDAPAKVRRRPSWWDDPAPWRWATAALVAAALVLIFMPLRHAPSNIALLSAPKSTTARFVAMEGANGLVVRAVAITAPPPGRAFELWAIYADTPRPLALGVMSKDGELRISALPANLGAGAVLAISVEPPGGSPTGKPTGPVVYTGTLGTL